MGDKEKSISIIYDFFANKNLDIRIKGNNPRFTDQKCTPDVICFIAKRLAGYFLKS
jgi:hypothetical protein